MQVAWQELRQRKMRLHGDAAKAMEDQASPAWLDTEVWPQYMTRDVRDALYHAFTDEELKDILRTVAAALGHLPSKKEVFCVYRTFILQRFQNWPKALVAAGLKPPKKQRRAANRLRMERSAAERERRRAEQTASAL